MKLLSTISLITAFAFNLVATTAPNPCQSLSEQAEIDECFMRIALEYGLDQNPRAPFGTLIVDHSTNSITCIGVNDNRKNILLHGEAVAFTNCTELYPSPTNDDLFNPGVAWKNQTLYTTGEPCPMCAAQIAYRNLKRVVWATSIKDVSKFGRQPQLTLDIHDVIYSKKVMGQELSEENYTTIEGGILQEECDHAFWCAFKDLRDAEYMKLMEESGELDYVLEHNQKFPCVTVPWRK